MTHAHHIPHVTAAEMPRVDARAVAGSFVWGSRGMSFHSGPRSIRVILQ